MYKLPHKLPNHLSFEILINLEISRKSQSFIEWLAVLSPTSEIKICQYLRKSSEKHKLKFFRSTLFHMKTRVSLKYFVNDCFWKEFLTSNLPQIPSNLICLTFFVNLWPLTQF